MDDEEGLECPVCLERYDEDLHTPKMMACLHTVCHACLADLSGSAPPQQPEIVCPGLTCPLCREQINPDRLQTNRYILSHLRHLQRLNSKQGKDNEGKTERTQEMAEKEQQEEDTENNCKESGNMKVHREKMKEIKREKRQERREGRQEKRQERHERKLQRQLQKQQIKQEMSTSKAPPPPPPPSAYPRKPAAPPPPYPKYPAPPPPSTPPPKLIIPSLPPATTMKAPAPYQTATAAIPKKHPTTPDQTPAATFFPQQPQMVPDQAYAATIPPPSYTTLFPPQQQPTAPQAYATTIPPLPPPPEPLRRRSVEATRQHTSLQPEHQSAILDHNQQPSLYPALPPASEPIFPPDLLPSAPMQENEEALPLDEMWCRTCEEPATAPCQARRHELTPLLKGEENEWLEQQVNKQQREERTQQEKRDRELAIRLALCGTEDEVAPRPNPTPSLEPDPTPATPLLPPRPERLSSRKVWELSRMPYKKVVVILENSRNPLVVQACYQELDRRRQEYRRTIKRGKKTKT